MIGVDVRADNPAGRISPLVLGHFVEHMGRCVYEGIANEQGMIRADVAHAVELLRPPLIRYPGGCFAAEYHWREGIGATRVHDRETFWSRVGLAPPESNLFGTDEFLDFCHRVGAEPYFTVNMGTGTAREAADWVAYCTGKVRHWSLGNEVFGPWETGHEGAADYAEQAAAFAAEITTVEPDLELVAVGADPRDYLHWNEEVLSVLGDAVGSISLHFYAPGTEAGPLHDTRDGYLSVVAAPYAVADSIDRMTAGIRRMELPTKIALDEWAVWSCDDELLGAAQTGSSSAVRDALFAAGLLHRLIERPNAVSMACYAQLANVLGLIQTSKDSLFVTPTYLVFELYEAIGGADALGVEVNRSPRYEAPNLGTVPRIFEVPFIDAAAVRAHEGHVLLFVVNRHPSIPMEVQIQGFSGEARIHRIVGPGPFARNSFDAPDAVRIEEASAVLPAAVLPPHSVSRFELDV